MRLDSFSKEQHFHEVARKESLNASVAFPVGLVVVIAGGIAVLTKTIHFPLSFTGLIQFNLVAASSILLVVACYLLARAYWNYGYGHMPSALQLSSYAENLKAYYISLGETESTAAEKANEETANYITGQFATNADTNAACNDKKSSYLFKANGFVIASIIPLVIAAPLHFYKESSSVKEPIKVEIVQSKESKMSNQEKPNTPPSTPPPPIQQERPTPPPSRIIKEHVDPTKK